MGEVVHTRRCTGARGGAAMECTSGSKAAMSEKLASISKLLTASELQALLRLETTRATNALRESMLHDATTSPIRLSSAPETPLVPASKEDKGTNTSSHMYGGGVVHTIDASVGVAPHELDRATFTSREGKEPVATYARAEPASTSGPQSSDETDDNDDCSTSTIVHAINTENGKAVYVVGVTVLSSSSKEISGQIQVGVVDAAAGSARKWKGIAQRSIIRVKKDKMKENGREKINDGLKWRKYGEKSLKDSPYTRSYYRSTTKGLTGVVRKQVERDRYNDEHMILTYEGKLKHNVIM